MGSPFYNTSMSFVKLKNHTVSFNLLPIPIDAYKCFFYDEFVEDKLQFCSVDWVLGIT